MVLPLILGLPVHGVGWHRVWPANKYTLRGLSAAFVKPQYPNGIVGSVSFIHQEHREKRGRLRLPGIDADAVVMVFDPFSPHPDNLRFANLEPQFTIA